MTGPVRVVLADDHPMFRYGLRAIWQLRPRSMSSARLRMATSSLRLLSGRSLMLWSPTSPCPAWTALPPLPEILQRHPEIGVLVLTMHDDDEALFAALRAGARGYLLKDADRDDIVRGILAVAAGEVLYGASVARRIINFFTGAHRQYASLVFPELTVREREVLQLVAAGRGNHDIARRLILSEKTVRNHVAVILAKLQARDRAALVAKARDAGIGTQP